MAAAAPDLASSSAKEKQDSLAQNKILELGFHWLNQTEDSTLDQELGGLWGRRPTLTGLAS